MRAVPGRVGRAALPAARLLVSEITAITQPPPASAGTTLLLSSLGGTGWS